MESRAVCIRPGWGEGASVALPGANGLVSTGSAALYPWLQSLAPSGTKTKRLPRKAIEKDDAAKQQLNSRARRFGQTEKELNESEARRHWLALAYSRDPSFDAMNQEIGRYPRGEQHLLKEWLDQFEKPPEYEDAAGNPGDKWWILIQEGRASSDRWGKRWNVRVKVGSDGWQWLKDNHDWDQPTKHDYPPRTGLAVPWKPGQPIRIELNRVRSLKNELLIDSTFDGPLAIWQLHNARWLYFQEGDDWVGIKLAVWNCPGPSLR